MKSGSASMKGMRIGLVVGVLMMAACVPRRQPPPPAPTPAPPVQRPRPVPPPPPAPADWRDLPLTAGNWVYRGTGDTTQALFGVANSEAQFIVRCERARRQISLWREGRGSGGAMTIRTSGLARALPVSVQAEPMAYVWATLPATDRFLEEMIFSRGRITVETPGLPILVLPAWAEPARVVEDCRG
jgi:hypothetical protein